MSRLRMKNHGLYMGSHHTPLGEYIPHLNLFYDEHNDVYYNENGRIIHDTPIVENNMNSLKPDTKKSHVPFDVVLQILALVLAAAAQYNVLENKITESENQLAVYKAVTDERFNSVPQMYRDMDALRAKQEELMREIDELKFKSSKK